ncbi:hypothetical protein TNCV_3309511 [Trichonephila clavipes]|nr:hypothetical protein TNCV_3309511 [Trichonephila clavipes]
MFGSRVWLSLHSFCCYRPKSLHPSGYSADSGSPSLKGNRNFYLLVLEVLMYTQTLLSVFEEKSNTNVEVNAEDGRRTEGPCLASRPCNPPSWVGLFHASNNLIGKRSGSSHGYPRLSPNPIGA